MKRQRGRGHRRNWPAVRRLKSCECSSTEAVQTEKGGTVYVRVVNPLLATSDSDKELEDDKDEACVNTKEAVSWLVVRGAR